MEILKLEGKSRDLAIKPKKLLAKRQIPAVFYGAGEKNLNLQVFEGDFVKLFRIAGESTLVELTIDEKEKKTVLIHTINRDPVTDKIIHIDFISIDMKKALTTKIPLEFIGISPAVKNLGGVLNANRHEIDIKCLPSDLVHNIQVDISSLIDFRTVIRVSDLVLPKGITCLEDPKDVIITAVPMKAEVVEEKPAEAIAAEAAGPAGAEAEKEAEGSKKEDKK